MDAVDLAISIGFLLGILGVPATLLLGSAALSLASGLAALAGAALATTRIQAPGYEQLALILVVLFIFNLLVSGAVAATSRGRLDRAPPGPP